MAIFVVFQVRDPVAMERAVQLAFPADHLQVDHGQWLIAASGTVKEVTDKLKITPAGESGSAIVFSMANFYGRAPMEVWEWIRTRAEDTSG